MYQNSDRASFLLRAHRLALPLPRAYKVPQQRWGARQNHARNAEQRIRWSSNECVRIRVRGTCFDPKRIRRLHVPAVVMPSATLVGAGHVARVCGRVVGLRW